MTFENLIGNSKVKSILKEVIETKNFLHSYLFTGIEGIGKKEFAKEFAKNILCLGEKNCKSCIEFDTENHPDFLIIEPDGNSVKIEQIRMMQIKIIEKPIISNKKVYIINDSEKMTKEAQNCLLKTLEEPPEYVVILLICSNESLLLNTIKSRCTKITFQPIPEQEMKTFLQKKGFENITQNLLKTMNGSISKAYELQQFGEIYKLVEENLENATKIDKVDFVNNLLPIYKQKENIYEILEYMEVILYNKSVQNIQNTNCVEVIEKAKNRIKQNANLDMTLDNMLWKIWDTINQQ